MIINFLNKLNGLNEWLFHGFDSFVENFGFPEWIADAIIDSFHILPFLFVVFVFIELFEYYYAHKINHFMKETEKAGPVIGSLASIVPQCGFSIIASSLYSGRLITKGTLIAIYLATSDEAIPVLLARPDKVWLVVPVITVKLVVAIIAGYLIDFIFKTKIDKDAVEEIPDEGCCKHDILSGSKNNLWLHPLVHTVNVFAFVLVITLFLNCFMTDAVISAVVTQSGFKYKILEPVVTGSLGLIPNCAVSIAFTMMLIKGTISFGAAMAGLCSNAGLGLLVLIRKNSSLKDTALVISLLLLISILCGIVLQFLWR